MRKSIITLLTDFGTRDHYVASMKGIVLSINPECHLVDISHEVPSYDIEKGAFILLNAYSCFPDGTIHLAIVDPGVGSPRRPILVETESYFFVGPDNGLFTFVLKREKVKQVIVLTNKKYFLPRLSRTFHGRDLFAPVAAHLSLGLQPRVFGKRAGGLETLPFRGPAEERGSLAGEIFHIDAFGNLVSNIDEGELSRFAGRHPFVIKVRNRTIQGLRKGYWEGKKKEPIGLIGSGGFLEISVSEGNAAQLLRMKKGDIIQVHLCKGNEYF